MSKNGFVKLLILIVIILTFSILSLAGFTVKTFRVADGAMQPTIENEQRVVINKLAYFKSSPKRGDIIVTSSSRSLIRRIIGLPEEMIEIRKGKVYVNNQLLDEPYLVNVQGYDFDQEAVKLDSTHYMILADNRKTAYYKGTQISVFALVPKNFILGKYWFSY